ncbi:drug/metabolite transporter, DME family [Plantibacter sp. VKM Ac-1784]|uniref:Drug/metabolite transporter, DME family n=1 Tax=Plantibacter elymi (nom. nud.) TaxID=199708 RepID=A0ABY1RFX2_9MICO|nr:EamA family transporter [Plantibacter sp. VKM Ac-1784]SMQ73216.1 drug/metabolite transporter, DME family [Plantibacter sp. VKM Ac-1784]
MTRSPTDTPSTADNTAAGRLPVAAAILAAVCFGTTGTAHALLPIEVGSVAFGAARIVFGGALLVLVWVAFARRPRSTPPRTHAAKLGRPALVVAVVVGTIGVTAYQPFFFLGVERNGVAIGTLTALGSAPAITGLLEWAIHRRRPSARWFLATIVAAAGVAVLSGVTGGGIGTVSADGLLASVGAGASYALYTLCSKALIEHGWTPLGTMAALFGAAALVSVPILLTTETAWILTAPGALAVAWLALVNTVAGYLLFGYALGGLPASRVATLTLFEPLTATLLGILLLGESFGPSTVVGAALLVTGLAILVVPKRIDRREVPR